MKRRYRLFDVFTERPLAGNPLAVVLDSEGLDSAAMQTIAREFSLRRRQTKGACHPHNPPPAKYRSAPRDFRDGTPVPLHVLTKHQQQEDVSMKSFLMTSAAAAVLSLGLAAPAAADCAAEIASLKQETFTGSVNATTADAATTAPADQMAAAPAAAGAETPAATGGETAQTTAVAPSADQSGTAGMSSEQTAAMDSAGTEAGQAAPAEGTAGAVPGTEATAAMNDATEGIATSPAEVEGQQTAQPAETAPSAEQLATADGPLAPVTSPTSGGEPVDLNAAMLARAEAYHKLGNEDACMNLVDQAKAT